MEVRARSTEDIYSRLIQDFYDKGYGVADSFLPADSCAGILAELQAEQADGAFHKAGVGKDASHQVIHTLRGDYIKWLEPDAQQPHTLSYLRELDHLRLALNRRCFLGLQDYEVHMTQYPPNTCYHRHVDAFYSDDNRRVSIVLYLNFDWRPEHDGRLLLYPENNKGGSVEILPKVGRLALFESILEHEVLPATQRRYSITGWMLRDKRLF